MRPVNLKKSTYLSFEKINKLVDYLADTKPARRTS